MSRFVIHHVVSGPQDLQEQLPVTGYTVNAVTDTQGGGEFFYAVLETPLKVRDDASAITDQSEHERSELDGREPYRLVTHVVLHPHIPGEQPHPGMTNFAMDMADDVAGMDPARVPAIAVIAVDDLPSHDAQTDEPASSFASHAPAYDLAPAASVGIGALPDSGAADLSAPALAGADPASAGGIQNRIDEVRIQLAALVGERPFSEVPAPVCVPPGQEKNVGGPAYSVRPDGYGYFSRDPLQGLVLRETVDPDELVYWIADDMARTAAWQWTTRAPSFGTMTTHQAQRILAMSIWHSLMYALSLDWGRRTRKTVLALHGQD